MEAYKKCLELAGDDPAYSSVALKVAKHLHDKKEFNDALTYFDKVQGKVATYVSFKIMVARSQQKIGNNGDRAFRPVCPESMSFADRFDKQAVGRRIALHDLKYAVVDTSGQSQENTERCSR